MPSVENSSPEVKAAAWHQIITPGAWRDDPSWVVCSAKDKKVVLGKGPHPSLWREREWRYSFEEAVALIAKSGGKLRLGYIFDALSPVSGIDEDHVESNPERAAEVEGMLREVGYHETSSSGGGRHHVVLGKLDPGVSPAPRTSPINGEKHPYSVEIYSGCRNHLMVLTGRDASGEAKHATGTLKLLAKKFPLTTDGRERKPSADGPVKHEPHDVETLKSALSAIDPSMESTPEHGRGRDVWVGMLAAIKEGFPPERDEEGLDIACSWSAGEFWASGAPWNFHGDADVTAAWDSIVRGREGGSGPGKVYAVAREKGWKGYAPSAEEDFADFKEESPAGEDEGSGEGSDADVEDPLALGERYYFVSKQGGYFDRDAKVVVPPATLDKLHRDEWFKGEMQVIRMNSKGEIDRKTPSHPHHFIDVACRRTGNVVHNVVWLPGGQERVEFQGRDCVNLFRPPETPASFNEDPSVWLRHVEYLIPNEKEREHVLDWLAFLVQNLDAKVHHALVLYGAQGTGKDALLEPLRYWLDGRGWRGVALDELTNRTFQHFLAETKLLVVQESKELEYGASQHLYNSFKSIISSPDHLTVNEKHMKPYAVPNVVQVVFTTNYANGVYFEDEDDRRYYVVHCADVRRDELYYESYWSWLKLHWRAAIGWLARREVTLKPGAPPPMTEAKKEMHKATRPMAEHEVEQILASVGDGPFRVSDLAERTFGKHSSTQLLVKNSPALEKLLKRNGYTKARIRAGGDRVTIWFRGMDEGAAKALFIQAQGPVGSEVKA